RLGHRLRGPYRHPVRLLPPRSVRAAPGRAGPGGVRGGPGRRTARQPQARGHRGDARPDGRREGVPARTARRHARGHADARHHPGPGRRPLPGRDPLSRGGGSPTIDARRARRRARRRPDAPPRPPRPVRWSNAQPLQTDWISPPHCGRRQTYAQLSYTHASHVEQRSSAGHFLGGDGSRSTPPGGGGSARDRGYAPVRGTAAVLCATGGAAADGSPGCRRGPGKRARPRRRAGRRAMPHVAGDAPRAPRRGRGPGGRQAPRSGLPRLEAGDAAVVVDGEAPAGAHLAPGVVAVADDETATAVDLLLDIHVAVGGEDLAVGPVGEVPLGTVVGHRRALGEHGREGLAVMVVDSRDEGADGRVAESRGLNRHASQRGPEPDAPPPTPPERRPPRFGPAARVRRWTGDEPLPRDRRETT